MNKTVIVISTYVDVIIREQQRDVKFLLFNSLSELNNHIETTPIRADAMYLTKETLEPMVNTSLTFLLDMLQNPFLSVDKVEYITNKGSHELASVRYIIQQTNMSNWRIVEGSMTREFVTGLITGTLRSEEIAPIRKAVYRQKRSDYLAERMNRRESLDLPFVSEEEELSEVRDEPVIDITPLEMDHVCKIVTIAGLEFQERTAFAFIMSQYLSHTGKTVIIERDYEYLTLSDMVAKSQISYARIDVSELYSRPAEAFRFIRNTKETMIIITCEDRSKYDYSFVCNLIYHNLTHVLDFLVIESSMEEVSTSVNYITVLPNNMVDILKTLEKVPDNFQTQATFVGINMRSLESLGAINTQVLTEVVNDVLQYPVSKSVPILNIRSLKLGGEAHDLRMLIKS